ncbi:protein-glutamate O-methyltransferase CheR [bacterium]|nr:protein-glutamate O-methyltransferase CheR [bacterium]
MLEVSKKMILDESDFEWFRRFIQKETGIHIFKEKHIFLYNRLLKRVNELNLDSFSAYRELIKTADAYREESQNLFNEITTNETWFFRYKKQFEVLRKVILRDIVAKRGNFGQQITINCFGCSSGQEPYSVAIFLAEELDVNFRVFTRINAVDLSTAVLQKAKKGFYSDSEVGNIPPELLRRYFAKEIDGYRILPRISNMVNYFHFNMNDENWNKFKFCDVILCRNTTIYFELRARERAIKKMVSSLRKGGFLILGHSEIIDPPDQDLKFVAHNIYRKV